MYIYSIVLTVEFTLNLFFFFFSKIKYFLVEFQVRRVRYSVHNLVSCKMGKFAFVVVYMYDSHGS